MDKAVEILSDSIATFEVSAQQLLDRHTGDLVVYLRLQKFIYGCKCACTANMNWRSVAVFQLGLELHADLTVQS
jgi:hypothetical protein